MSTNSPRPVLSIEDLDALRACGRGERNLGYVCCLVGVLVMITGRFMAGAPIWLTSLGVAVVVLGWGLLARSVFKRAVMGRSLSSKSGG